MEPVGSVSYDFVTPVPAGQGGRGRPHRALVA